MSSNPIGKNRKAMWQSLVLSTINRLHADDVRPDVMQATLMRVAIVADFLLDEMDKRFHEQPKPSTITVRKL